MQKVMLHRCQASLGLKVKRSPIKLPPAYSERKCAIASTRRRAPRAEEQLVAEQVIGRPLVLISSGDGEDGDSEWKTQVSQEKTFRTEEVEQQGI